MSTRADIPDLALNRARLQLPGRRPLQVRPGREPIQGGALPRASNSRQCTAVAFPPRPPRAPAGGHGLQRGPAPRGTFRELGPRRPGLLVGAVRPPPEERHQLGRESQHGAAAASDSALPTAWSVPARGHAVPAALGQWGRRARACAQASQPRPIGVRAPAPAPAPAPEPSSLGQWGWRARACACASHPWPMGSRHAPRPLAAGGWRLATVSMPPSEKRCWWVRRRAGRVMSHCGRGLVQVGVLCPLCAVRRFAGRSAAGRFRGCCAGSSRRARAGICALPEAPHCPWRVPVPCLPPAGPAVRTVGRRTPAASVLQPQGSQFSPSFQNHLFTDFSLFFPAFILLSWDLRFPSSLR